MPDIDDMDVGVLNEENEDAFGDETFVCLLKDSNTELKVVDHSRLPLVYICAFSKADRDESLPYAAMLAAQDVAEEGKVYIRYWMMQNLTLKEGYFAEERTPRRKQAKVFTKPKRCYKNIKPAGLNLEKDLSILETLSYRKVNDVSNDSEVHPVVRTFVMAKQYRREDCQDAGRLLKIFGNFGNVRKIGLSLQAIRMAFTKIDNARLKEDDSKSKDVQQSKFKKICMSRLRKLSSSALVSNIPEGKTEQEKKYIVDARIKTK